MESQPLVSIVVITYNSSKYVVDTLESAKAQSYENIELIISDDCSKDNTIDICRNWINENSKRFARTKLITTLNNAGIPANCNRGISASRGEYLKLIAGDDILLDKCIEYNTTEMVFANVDLSYSDMIFFNDEGLLAVEENYFLAYFSLITTKKQVKVYSRNSLFLNVPSWFIRRSLFEAVGGFDEKYHLLEDQVFLINSLTKHKKVKYLNKATVKYRVHNQSVVHSANPLLIKELNESLRNKRFPNLNIFNLKDLVYMLDAKLYLNSQTCVSNNLYLKILSKINVGKYLKRFMLSAPNGKLNLVIKKLIS